MIETRILLLEGVPPPGLPTAGAGWRLVPAGADPLAVAADLALAGDDCPLSDHELDRLALPLLVHTAGSPPPRLLDRAIGWLLPGDDVNALDLLVAGERLGVAEVSATAQHIAALSADARRIAEALEHLAKNADADPGIQISAALVRRLIRLRRDRDRHFPAEIFADPAWDMLLDLMAARMEGIDVPVSSLCVAAAVPTTTALRWIRALSEAGLLERRIDMADARRSFVTLSDTAQLAMQSWLRRFATHFQLR
ncbi:hypothetical protein [Sandarakinorhabdus sp.]|uniref:hypothetical protein n=1 Tax=Sandarakinorhabdus sp. TaxID=1916663 RepID=UPI003F70CA01